MSERLALVDYGAGNLRSAARALEVAGDGAGLHAAIEVTSDADVVASADRIVLPGVGAFGQCAAALRSLPGMIEALEDAVLTRGRPFLGICVGMQLLASRSEEHGLHEGLGWIEGDVVRLSPSDPSLKVPHMSWAAVERTVDGSAHPALAPVPDGGHAYFVHSYHMRPADARMTLATCDFAGPVTAVVGRDNILGLQFHPEKSQQYGLALLEGFWRWRP
jgi:glutamine amidotransferase